MKTNSTATKPSEPAEGSQVLERPIVDWPELLSSKTIDLQELEGQLNSQIQRATLLEAYISHRFNTGCGDQTKSRLASVRDGNKADSERFADPEEAESRLGKPTFIVWPEEAT